MDKISVIVPFYNSSNTIERCVDSILSQTYTNFEVLLVNDGSTDQSLSLIEKNYAKDKRIRLIDKLHAGVSSARNLGLQKAQGDYIQFIDSDDYIEPTMLEKMLSMSKEEDADIVMCNFDHPCIKCYLGDRVLDMTKTIDRVFICQSTFSTVLPWNKLYKRSVITEKFDEELAFAEDELFVLANLCNAKKLVSTSEVLYHYYAKPTAKKPEEMSCISSIAKADDFWRTKKTYWYMRAALMSKVDVILKNHFKPEEYDDIQYARIFDYMIWELIILYCNGAVRSGIISDLQNIFNEERFQDALKIRGKYGIRYRRFTAEEQNKRVLMFATDCMNAYDDIIDNHRSERPFYVCMALFIRYFMEPAGRPDTVDLMAALYVDLTKNMSLEGRYVNALLRQKQSVMDCAI